MTHSDNKTHGGKGVKAPTAKAAENYRVNYDEIDWSTGKGESKVDIDADWIPCTNALPMPNKWVIIDHTLFGVVPGKLLAFSKRWYIEGGCITKHENVTHWQPMPTSPRKVTT